MCLFYFLKDVYRAYFNSQKAFCVRNRALIPGDNAVICSESMLFLLGASEYAKWHMIMFWRRKTLLKYSYFLSETWGWAGSFATEGWKVRCKKRRGRSEIQIHESSWARSCRFLYPLVLVCLAPYLFFWLVCEWCCAVSWYKRVYRCPESRSANESWPCSQKLSGEKVYNMRTVW